MKVNPVHFVKNSDVTSENSSQQIFGFGFIISLFISALAIGIGALFIYELYHNNQQKPLVVFPSPVIPGRTSPNPNPSEILIPADWIAYTNNQNNFSFQYPSDWQVKGPVSSEDKTLVYIYSSEKIEQPGQEEVVYYIYVESLGQLPQVELNNDQINNQQVYWTTDFPSRSGNLTYIFTKSGIDSPDYIAISLTPFNSQQPFYKQIQYQQVFNLILSTFKFSES